MKRIIFLLGFTVLLFSSVTVNAHPAIVIYSVRPVMEMDPYHRALQMAYQQQRLQYQLQRAYLQNQLLRGQIAQLGGDPFYRAATQWVYYPMNRAMVHPRQRIHRAPHPRARCRNHACRRV